jgi:hypothetical protein
MGMSVDCEIENGNLEASYRNSLSSHIEELMTNDANYSVSTIITPSTIASDGIGSSLNDNNQDENENSGFYHMIYVEGQDKGKWTEIRTNLTCESIDFDWKKSANTFRLNSSMSMVLSGESSTSSPIYDDVEEFYDEFSQYPVALFYSIEQECFIPPGEGHHPLVYVIGDGEYFQLGMGFLFVQNESGEG